MRSLKWRAATVQTLRVRGSWRRRLAATRFRPAFALGFGKSSLAADHQPRACRNLHNDMEYEGRQAIALSPPLSLLTWRNPNEAPFLRFHPAPGLRSGGRATPPSEKFRTRNSTAYNLSSVPRRPQQHRIAKALG